ncbi:MAG: phosphoribosyltransferase family protein [Nitrososphaerota archaeon]
MWLSSQVVLGVIKKILFNGGLLPYLVSMPEINDDMSIHVNSPLIPINPSSPPKIFSLVNGSPISERVIYRDRVDAGLRLAEGLRDCLGPGSVVYGIARGGVVVAGVVARRLGCALDVIVVKKIGAPFNPELAAAAVTEFGDVAVEDEVVAFYGISQEEILKRASEQVPVLRKRAESYRGGRGFIDAAGKAVAIIDDGLATGTTMVAAVQSIKKMKPSRLIASAPVASTTAASKLRPLVDEVVCPYVEEEFYAVGEFYDNFAQVTDEEVIRYLRGDANSR